MARPLLTLIFPLIVAAFAAIVAICSHHYDPSELSPLLSPPSGCTMPCWGGIRPGETTVDEAVSLLEDNAWVSDVYQSMNAVDWVWNGSQPRFFDTSSPTFQGRIELTDWESPDTTIASVVIRTHLTFGELWLSLGQPDRIDIRNVDASDSKGIVHIASYERYGLYVFNFLSCPIHPAEFWNRPVMVAFGGPNLPYTDLARQSPYRLPDWFFRNQGPGCGV